MNSGSKDGVRRYDVCARLTVCGYLPIVVVDFQSDLPFVYLKHGRP